MNYLPKFDHRVLKAFHDVMTILPYTISSALLRSHEHYLFLEVMGYGN
jgi:hypothetical protein